MAAHGISHSGVSATRGRFLLKRERLGLMSGFHRLVCFALDRTAAATLLMAAEGIVIE